MGRCILLADIHLKHERADSILNSEPHDRAVFLNDIFDDFNDNAEQNRNTAIWFKEKINDPKNVFVWSNHVQSYAYDFNLHMSCSGFTREKSKVIWEVLNRDDFNKIQLYHVEQGFLLTHAGLTNPLLKEKSNGETIDTIEKVSKFLDDHYSRAKFALEAGGNHWLFAAGWTRGGLEKYGGCTWEDFGAFIPTPFPQIVGHTPLKTPVFKTMNKNGGIANFASNDAQVQDFKGKKFCLGLDTHLNHYAILEDGELTIKHVLWCESDLLKNDIKTTIRIFKGKLPIVVNDNQ